MEFKSTHTGKRTSKAPWVSNILFFLLTNGQYKLQVKAGKSQELNFSIYKSDTNTK